MGCRTLCHLAAKQTALPMRVIIPSLVKCSTPSEKNSSNGYVPFVSSLLAAVAASRRNGSAWLRMVLSYLQLQRFRISKNYSRLKLEKVNAPSQE